MYAPSLHERALSVRLAVYTDYEYRSDGTRRYGQRAFVVFLEALRPHVERLVLVGRLDPRPGRSHYPLREDTELVGLPHYESLLSPLSVGRSLIVSLARFWRLLDDVDAVWVLGPYPHSVALALVTIVRRRTLDARRAPGHAGLRAQPPPGPALDAPERRRARGDLARARAPPRGRGRGSRARAEVQALPTSAGDAGVARARARPARTRGRRGGAPTAAS